MKLLVFSGWLMFTCLVCGQKTVLPFVRNGQWSLIDSSGSTITTTPFSYIHDFDDAGFTFFGQNGGYGIINNRGEVIVRPLYADVQQKGHGHYQLLTEKGWIPFEPGGFRLIGNDTIHSFDMLSGKWALTGTKSDWYLEHLISGKRWELPDSTANYKLLHNHLLIDLSDTNDLLINDAGDLVLSGSIFTEMQNELYHARSQEKHYLFDTHGKWPYDNIRRVSFESDALFILTDQEGYYLQYDGSVILKGDFSKISSFNSSFLQVTKRGLTTLFDRKTLQPVLPFRYESILMAGENYQVTLNGNNGLINTKFLELVPCKYQRIALKGDLAFVYELGYVGLYSLRKKKELLPPIYNTIRENNRRYKASRNEFITIIELDENHTVLKTAKIDNTLTVMPLKQRSTGNRPRKFIDPRLFPLGWFLDSTLIIPPKNEPSYFSLKWGLRNDQDSIVIPASISELKYVPQAPFTMQYTGQADYERNLKVQNYKPIFLPTGKILSKYTLFDFDSTDFLYRNFMRVTSAQGLGILRENGSYQSFTYLEQSVNRHLVYCNAKEIIPIEKKKDTEEKTPVPMLSFSSYYRNIPHPAIFKLDDYSKCVGFTYPDGEWNFLSPEGTRLFKDTFSFAFPFLGNQAIVKKGQKWGVVNEDTLIIPTYYSWIERTISGKDTFFVARMAQGGTRLLDSMSQTISPEGGKVFAYKNNTMILESKEGKQLVDAAFRPLSDHYISMKYLKNGLILAKNKKEHTLFTNFGEILYSGEEPPEEILRCGKMIVAKGNLFELYDSHMQLLLSGCSEIIESGDYTLAVQGEKNTVYRAGEIIFDGITGSVLMDSITGQICVWKKGKAVIYKSGIKSGNLKIAQPSHFYNGMLFITARDTCQLFYSNGSYFKTIPAVEELLPQGEGRLLIKTASKNNLFYDEQWEQLLPQEKKFRQLEQLSSEIYTYRNELGKMVFYNLQNRRIDTTNYEKSFGKFTSGRLLVKSGSRYSYLDETIRTVSKCTYKEAIPFSGKYAAVADQRGWTIIDQQCNPVVYPNFGKIVALAENVFSTPQLPLHGVYNASGKLLIPVAYQHIRFLPNGLILGIQDGSFTYFRKDGTAISIR